MQTVFINKVNRIFIWRDVVRPFDVDCRLVFTKRHKDVTSDEPSVKVVYPAAVIESCLNRYYELIYEEVPKISEGLANGLVYLRIFAGEWDLEVQCNFGSGEYVTVFKDLAFVTNEPE